MKSDMKKIDAVPVGELCAHLKGAEELWDDIPFPTQVRIVFRFVLEKLKDAVEAPLQKQEACMIDFVAALQLQSSEDDGDGNEGFRGSSTPVSWLVQRLIARARDVADSADADQGAADAEMEIAKLLEREMQVASPQQLALKEAAQAGVVNIL